MDDELKSVNLKAKQYEKVLKELRNLIPSIAGRKNINEKSEDAHRSESIGSLYDEEPNNGEDIVQNNDSISKDAKYSGGPLISLKDVCPKYSKFGSCRRFRARECLMSHPRKQCFEYLQKGYCKWNNCKFCHPIKLVRNIIKYQESN